MRSNSLTLKSVAGWIAFALPALAAGCATTNPTEALVQVNEFSATIQKVQADIDAGSQRIHAVSDQFSDILHFDFKHDALATFTEFRTVQEQSLGQLETLRRDVDTMKEASEPVFKKWLADLDNFQSTAMRLRSQQRMTETRRRFEAIVAAAESAQTTFEAFNTKMLDYAVFLAHDFNEESVASLRGDEHKLKDEVAALERSFEKCAQAAHDYVQSAALPTASSDESAADKKGP